MTLLKLAALAAFPVLATFVSQTPIENTNLHKRNNRTLLKLAVLAALPVLVTFVCPTPIKNAKAR